MLVAFTNVPRKGPTQLILVWTACLHCRHEALLDLAAHPSRESSAAAATPILRSTLITFRSPILVHDRLLLDRSMKTSRERRGRRLRAASQRRRLPPRTRRWVPLFAPAQIARSEGC